MSVVGVLVVSICVEMLAVVFICVDAGPVKKGRWRTERGLNNTLRNCDGDCIKSDIERVREEWENNRQKESADIEHSKTKMRGRKKTMEHEHIVIPDDYDAKKIITTKCKSYTDILKPTALCDTMNQAVSPPPPPSDTHLSRIAEPCLPLWLHPCYRIYLYELS